MKTFKEYLNEANKQESKAMVKISADEIVAQFGHSSACTLDPGYIGDNDSGWTITGEVHTDHYSWVNEFKATHPKLGEVYGDFEAEVFASSKQAYDHFVKHHEPDCWDYQDI